MGEIRQFSKVGEVVAVEEIKLNDLTNLQQTKVFMFECLRHMRGYAVEQPANDSRLSIRATREYKDVLPVTTETRE